MRLPRRRRRLVRSPARRAARGAPGEVRGRLGGRRPVPRGRPGRRSPSALGAHARASGRRPASPSTCRSSSRIAERHAPALLPAVARPGRTARPHAALHGSLPVPGQRPPLEPHPDVPAPGAALHPPVRVRPPRRLQPARPALLPGGRARRLRARAPAHGRSRRRAGRGRRLRAAPRAARAACSAAIRRASRSPSCRPRSGASTWRSRADGSWAASAAGWPSWRSRCWSPSTPT